MTLDDRLRDMERRSECANKLGVGELPQLHEKFYGTPVVFNSGDVRVWFGDKAGEGEPRPSQRWKEIHGADAYPPDNHYEDEYDLELARFFAHAPTDVPALLRAIREAERRFSDAVLRPYLYRGRPFSEYHEEFQAAVLAAMDGG